jgi:hypothetical protein
MGKTVIRFQERRGGWVYVKSASFAPGSGYRVKKVTLTVNRAEAFGFSLAAAQEIATQYSNRVVELIKDSGETSEGQAYVATKNAEQRAQRNEEIRQQNEAMKPFVEEIYRIIGKLA